MPAAFSEATMGRKENSVRAALMRMLSAPSFAERSLTMRAQLVHGIVLAFGLMCLLSIVVGVPFLFNEKRMAAAIMLSILAAALYALKLCRRGRMDAAARLLIGVGWLAAIVATLLSHRTDLVPFVPVLFIALVLSGPRMALAVAASAVVVFAGMHIALQLGVYWPRSFVMPPQSVLFFTILFLAIAAAPVAFLAHQLNVTINDFDQFRRAQRELRIVTWIWDVSTDTVWWDGDLSPLLGLPAGAFSGRFADYLECMPPEDREYAKQRYIDCIRGKQQFYGGEDRIVWPDGSRHWLAVRGQASYDSDGNAIRLTGVVSDITDRKASEIALDQTKRRLALAFHGSQDAILIARASDGRILDVNPAFAKLTGYARDEAIGRTGQELGLWISPVERERWHTALESQGYLRDWPLDFRKRDGTLLYTRMSTSTRVEFDGEMCWVHAARDVGDQLLAERRLRDSEAKYAAFFETTPDAAAISRWSDGAFLELNAAWSELTGYARQAGLGKSGMELQVWERPADRQAVFAELAASDRIINYATRFRRRDGSLRDILLSAVKLELNQEVCVAWTCRDVTERKRSQALLQNVARAVSSEVGVNFFHSLVGNLSRELAADYCFIGEVLEDDPTRVRTLSYCADGAQAPNFTYSLEGSPCSLALERKGSVAFPANVCIQFPQDIGLQRMGVEGYAGTSLFDHEGRGIGILVVMSRKSITEVGVWLSVLEIFGARAAAEIQRVRAEAKLWEVNATLEQRVSARTAELGQANQELESFSYSVSHDLRAPLRAINGLAGVLASDYGSRLDGFGASLVSQIGEQALRMGRLIEGLLEFARAGRGTMDPRPINMSALVDEVVAELRRGAQCEARIEIGELPQATGDEVVVRQVWQNLIANALKFSCKAAQPRVQIAGEARGGMIEYTVRDNGVGFDQAQAGRMFEVFRRLHAGREFEGSGVGLAIARRIVQRHGGSISAEGRLGLGAIFRFTLPA